MDPITEYVEAIESGQITTSVKVHTIYKRLAEGIANDDQAWTYDSKKAGRAIFFCEHFCRHGKGQFAGKLFKLELWQKALVAAVFGIVERDTGLRYHREVFLAVARKCGKSQLAAFFAVYMLLEERGGEVYTISTKLDQSSIIFKAACSFVAQDKHLSKRIRKRQFDLYVEKTDSTFRPLGSRSNSMDGMNASLVIADEVHAWRGRQGRELYSVMRQAQSSRSQPLFLSVTTMGFETDSIFTDLYAESEGIIDGTIENPRFLPVIYELDEQDEWKDEPIEVDGKLVPPPSWYKANPNLGVSKTYESLIEIVARARQVGGSLEKTVLTKDFNTAQTAIGAWLDLDDIRNEETFDLEEFRGGYCVGGVDLSLTTDLTSACILMAKDGKICVHSMAWIPSETVESHIQNDLAPYDRWIANGYVRVCEGNRIDPHDVTLWFDEVVERHGITPFQIGYDPYCSEYWVKDMEQAGYRLEVVRQGGRTLNAPMQNLTADLKAHKVVHNSNPVLVWCMSNVSVEISERNQTILPCKNSNPKLRIDSFAAMLDAYVEYERHATLWEA